MTPNLFKPSTRAFWKEGRRVRGFGFKDFVHGYIYARFPYTYIAVATSRHPLARLLRPLSRLFADFNSSNIESARRAFAQGYHGKALPLDTARRLILVNRSITVDLEHVLPYEKARELVLKSPRRIALLECPCRASKPNPCLPLDVCLIIGDPLASFIIEHHPKKSREIGVQEALEVLEAEHRRGHVHHAFFKDAMLGRFYAICNCCSCCCGAMWAHGHGVPMLCSSGYVASINLELCQGCGSCAKACPFQAIQWIDARPRIRLEACMGCGVCAGRCPQQAIRLELDPAKPGPLNLEELQEASC